MKLRWETATPAEAIWPWQALGVPIASVGTGFEVAVSGTTVAVAEGPRSRLQLLDADPDDLPASAGEPQLSLGIATVDAERFAADRGWAIATLPGDALVGAFAWGVEGHRSLILLEPNIEARLAATLARHAEGPAVLYLRFTATPLASLRRRLVDAGLIASAATAGPFGPECLVGAGPAWGPHLVVSGS